MVQKKRESRVSALEQIRALLDAAALAFAKDSAAAQRIVTQAHQLALRTRIRLPAVLKRRFCKKCRSLWVPSKTVRVRLAQGRVVYSCLVCKRIWRLPLA